MPVAFYAKAFYAKAFQSLPVLEAEIAAAEPTVDTAALAVRVFHSVQVAGVEAMDVASLAGRVIDRATFAAAETLDVSAIGAELRSEARFDVYESGHDSASLAGKLIAFATMGAAESMVDQAAVKVFHGVFFGVDEDSGVIVVPWSSRAAAVGVAHRGVVLAARPMAIVPAVDRTVTVPRVRP